MLKLYIKKILCACLANLNLDYLFRWLNRKKCLVVMYHGITEKNYDIPVWTQLSSAIFEQQIKFLKKRYNIISLSMFMDNLLKGKESPEYSALITFDDGYKNNFLIAYPILKKYSVPATIFLPTNLIGNASILWEDEIWLLLLTIVKNKINLKNIKIIPEEGVRINNIHKTYQFLTQHFKFRPESEKKAFIEEIKSIIHIDDSMIDDFKLLCWEDVLELSDSGFIEFGVHTANHRILSTLTDREIQSEIINPRLYLSSKIGRDIKAFAYPTGRPCVDFNKDHVHILSDNNYACAFTTESGLFDVTTDDPYQIRRIGVGSDFTSNKYFFWLNTSGFWSSIKMMF